MTYLICLLPSCCIQTAPLPAPSCWAPSQGLSWWLLPCTLLLWLAWDMTQLLWLLTAHSFTTLPSPSSKWQEVHWQEYELGAEIFFLSFTPRSSATCQLLSLLQEWHVNHCLYSRIPLAASQTPPSNLMARDVFKVESINSIFEGTPRLLLAH
jgi:IS1 family transposase